jgi:hypothetical protein
MTWPSWTESRRKAVSEYPRVRGRRNRKHQLAAFLIQREVEERAALRLGGNDRLEALPRCRVRPEAQQVAAVLDLARDQAVRADLGYRREPLFQRAGVKGAGGWGLFGHRQFLRF